MRSGRSARAHLLSTLRRVLPDHPLFLPIWRGPLRGGVFFANPRASLRKVFGFYEQELNGWLENAIAGADLVFDVGANDGYFTFGCAAAMRRRGKRVRVVSIEPITEHVRQLHAARDRAGYSEDQITIVPKCAGRSVDDRQVTLDTFAELRQQYTSSLIKIDVEGAEMDVLDGAAEWLSPGTVMLIEVHRFAYLDAISKRLALSIGPLDRIDQKPHPLLGREIRDAANWWLVSRLP